MTDALQKLFGNPARIKLLRLFLFNPRRPFTFADMTDRSRVNGKTLRKEIKLFTEINVVKKARRAASAPGARFVLNDTFEYREPLQTLLLNTHTQSDSILGRLRGVGGLRLLILAGVFMGEWEGSLDLLVVGERINEKKLRERVRRLESEIGRELRYATLTTQDFYYRLNMNDHLVRDVLDLPHKVVLDRLNVTLN